VKYNIFLSQSKCPGRKTMLKARGKNSSREEKERKHTLRILWLGICVLVISIVPQAVFAQEGNVSKPIILLGFKERYGNENKQHLGIDVALARGESVYSPIDGEISFVGRVPGSAGLNVTALTIKSAEGNLVSINPLESTAVQKGDSVKKSQRLGEISDKGDPSSPESHFHLSLRVNSVYKDPSSLILAVMGATGNISPKTDDNNSAASAIGKGITNPSQSSSTSVSKVVDRIKNTSAIKKPANSRVFTRESKAVEKGETHPGVRAETSLSGDVGNKLTDQASPANKAVSNCIKKEVQVGKNPKTLSAITINSLSREAIDFERRTGSSKPSDKIEGNPNLKIEESVVRSGDGGEKNLHLLLLQELSHAQLSLAIFLLFVVLSTSSLGIKHVLYSQLHLESRGARIASLIKSCSGQFLQRPGAAKTKGGEL
jgi:hypothetical protein